MEHPLAREPCHWDLGDRALYIGDLAWLLKELGWILLVPWLSLPCGLAAAGCACFAAASHVTRRPVEEWAPEVVMAIWCSANVAWMAGEVLWDVPDQQTPWAMTPVMAEDQEKFSQVQLVAMAGFALGPLVYAGAVSYCWHKAVRSSSADASAPLTILLSGFVVTWCLKDLFWIKEQLWLALAADCATVVLLVGAATFSSGQGLPGIDKADLAWVIWVLSNTVWLLCELAFTGDLVFRYCAAGGSLVAFMLFSQSYQQVKRRALRIRSVSPTISKPDCSEGGTVSCPDQPLQLIIGL